MFDTTTTFFSVWYWLLTAVFWSLASHFTHNVPHDIASRAARLGGEDARIFDLLARRSLARIDAAVSRHGAWGAALAGFVLAALGVLAFGARLEMAQGLFAMVGPAAVLAALSVREARELHALQPPPDELLRRFESRRRVNQAGGMTAIFLTVLLFSIKHADRIFFYTAF